MPPTAPTPRAVPPAGRQRPTLSATDGAEYVPKASPTTPDAVCWIWAAIPTRADGRIDLARVAAAVDRSPVTVRRWIRQADTRPLDPRALRVLRTRANLRGHGDYLWPPLNQQAAEAAAARRAKDLWRLQVLNDGNAPQIWAERELVAHTVVLYYHPGARVFGVASTKTTSRARASQLRKTGAHLIDSLEVPTRIHAAVLKGDALELAGDHRCLPPRSFIPDGRTETWLRRGGDVDLTALALARLEMR